MSSSGEGSRRLKTIQNNDTPSGSKGVEPKDYIHAIWCNDDILREAVKLPIGEDLNEWLASNTVDFFRQVNILYSTITKFCTPKTCPIMTAGPKYEYRWADGVTIKKPIVVSAPKYIDYLMDWIATQFDDATIFPLILGAPFPPNFQNMVKTIVKKLFRVYAHIYHSHYNIMLKLNEATHFNTCFKHLVMFSCEFGLLGTTDIAPLKDMVESILQS